MNKRGVVYFATLTMIVIAVATFAWAMRKEKILEEEKIIEAGKVPEAVLYFTLEEEKVDFFIQKAVEVAAYRALVKLGEEGGMYNEKSEKNEKNEKSEESCEKVEGKVIWDDKCELSRVMPEIFLWYFQEEFDSYIKEYGLEEFTSSWDRDEKGEYLEVSGNVTLNYEGVSYGFESNFKYYSDYNFGKYGELWRVANGCVRAEERKPELFRNNQFEECRKRKGERWEIKVVKGFVLFEVVPEGLYKELGEVPIKFAFNYNG